MNRSSSSLQSIQALRGFAALYVVVFHSGLALAHTDMPALAWLTTHVIKRGHVGVDVFFVISGFIIAWVAILGPKGPEAPGEFLVKRAFRLAPPYWLMSVLHSTWLNPVSTGVLLSSLAFLPQANVDAPYFGYPALYVGWSLNYEAFFYALCALGLALFGRRALWLVALALFTTTIIVPFWHSGVVLRDPEALYTWATPLQAMAANPLVLEFLLGAGLAWLYAEHRHRLTPALAHVLLAAGLGAFIVSVVGPVPRFDLLARGLPAGALLIGLVAMEYRGLLRVPRAAVWLGELSYALYLVHPSVIEATHRLVGVLAPEWIGTQVLLFAVNLALTLALAALLHRYIEQPSIALGRKTIDWMDTQRHAWRARLGLQKP
ncbi:acyltransferase family protein [Ralstonia insidiosa]|uniref:Acyltransferase family protein n=1 Tax=Ralstonia insidiosa TaxID=190721 RepID=A0AAC9BME2_9RALS|nr:MULTISPECIES: acyltransferase [Ralstonia]ANH76716.1 acyltransferase family protein [Ralstonia insidiosa]EPX99064.1 acyltransferase [Ralstonia sp. AU12-08]MBY4705902.1 acyltransferase [Ralstonia insidiosa]GAQ26952.1 acyltransferase protein [Ralstonia sp. NT80]